jgi:superfamily II DNA/RNA helicase
MGFTHPTKVQREAIPVVISGKDVVVSSMTGSGKTGAFLLPALQRFGGTSSSNYSKVLVVPVFRYAGAIQ